MLPQLGPTTGLSPVYLDYSEYFMTSGNVITFPYTDVATAFKTPVSVNSTAFGGPDWTKPYPGVSKAGHMAYLEVAHEMPISEAIVENAITVLSSLTFDVPDGLTEMDPSWYICRHLFVSTKPEAKQAVNAGGNCDFLSQACRDDLKTGLTQNWGKGWEEDGTMCGGYVFDSIPTSCRDTFGFARQDVIAFDNSALEDTSLAGLQTSKEQQQYSWRLGTGFHDPGDARSQAIAANRTYLVANVWGYSESSKSIQVPEVSFGCLTGGKR